MIQIIYPSHCISQFEAFHEICSPWHFNMNNKSIKMGEYE